MASFTDNQFTPVHSTMMKAKISFWHFAILILNRILISLSKSEVIEKWIEQSLDHFDPNNGRKWWMRYYENDVLFEANGPMFIMIGGESTITPEDVETGFMFDMAEIFGAILYHIEHRYYGGSRPVPDATFGNLKYLSVEQALADIASFIIMKREELGIPDIPVIVFGGSYAGNLAAWMRIKYSNLVYGAVAVSAPVYVEAEFPEYFNVVANSLRKYDENCVTMIAEAFSELEELLKNSALSSVMLKNDFNLCDEPDLSQSHEVTLMVSSFAQFIGNAVVQNSVEPNGETSIANLCTRITENDKNRSAYHRLAGIISRNHLGHVPCLQLNYNKVAEHYAKACWATTFVNSRMWNYQTCTELGYKQTFSSPKSIFGSRASMQYFMKICEDIFGEDFCPDILNDNVKRINLVNNAGLSNATNIIFINGDLDPWHVLSVLHDLNDDSPAILIPGTSHCEFLRPKAPKNFDSISEARCKVAGILFDFIDKLI